MLFRIHDVGGQKSDRRKWLNLFDCVHAVAFCVSLTSYENFYSKNIDDSNIYTTAVRATGHNGYSGGRRGNPDEVNQLRESLRLFTTIVNSKVFIDAAMILFLSKTDLFLVSHLCKNVKDTKTAPFERNLKICY